MKIYRTKPNAKGPPDWVKAFYIAHGPAIHAGALEGEKEVWTGQKELETFVNQTQWEKRLTELGYEPPKEEVI